MDLDSLRRLCLEWPGATERVQWEALVFKVLDKIFAIAALEPQEVWLTIKSTPEEFYELVERPGIVPAPYLARAKWVALESPTALPDFEIKALLRRSYDLVVEKLPARSRAALAAGKLPARRRKSPARAPKRKARRRK